MLKKIELAKKEIEKVIVGKEKIIEKIFMAMLSGGHVLLEDILGVGKTTLVLAFSRSLGLEFNNGTNRQRAPPVWPGAQPTDPAGCRYRLPATGLSPLSKSLP